MRFLLKDKKNSEYRRKKETEKPYFGDAKLSSIFVGLHFKMNQKDTPNAFPIFLSKKEPCGNATKRNQEDVYRRKNPQVISFWHITSK